VRGFLPGLIGLLIALPVFGIMCLVWRRRPSPTFAEVWTWTLVIMLGSIGPLALLAVVARIFRLWPFSN
jgi:hypothetical protein